MAYDAMVPVASAVTAAQQPGLVGISTTRPRHEIPLWQPPEPGSQVITHLAAYSIEIDRAAARIDRLRKAIATAGDCIQMLAESAREKKIFVTLTYRGDNSAWRANHIRDYLHAVRKWYARQTGAKLKYVWVAELQERGVIHYHIVYWLPLRLTMPKADKRGWWPHGMTNTKPAKRPVGYLMKYASKADQKTIGRFPHGARIYGVGGLDNDGRCIKRWRLMPRYLQCNVACTDRIKPMAGGGYVNLDTGEKFQSEFQPLGCSYRRFIRVRQAARAVEPAGPFSWMRS